MRLRDGAMQHPASTLQYIIPHSTETDAVYLNVYGFGRASSGVAHPVQEAHAAALAAGGGGGGGIGVGAAAGGGGRIDLQPDVVVAQLASLKMNEISALLNAVDTDIFQKLSRLADLRWRADLSVPLVLAAAPAAVPPAPPALEGQPILRVSFDYDYMLAVMGAGSGVGGGADPYVLNIRAFDTFPFTSIPYRKNLGSFLTSAVTSGTPTVWPAQLSDRFSDFCCSVGHVLFGGFPIYIWSVSALAADSR